MIMLPAQICTRNTGYISEPGAFFIGVKGFYPFTIYE